MRWLVEVTSLGKTEKDALHVDADSWQKALQLARGLRGEGEPMAGFSIELLEEGCRAVDPIARLSYEVHRAGANDDPRANAPRPSAFPVAIRPSSVPQPIDAPPQMLVKGPIQSAPVGPIAPTPPRVEPAALPSQIVFKREQDATEALPLTYREYVYVVPPGTPDAAAATLAQTQLELVRASLERAPAGKLVNLAVFDATFQGKPTVPPMVTITWKDWRGAALLTFPRQPGRAPIAIIAPMSSVQAPSLVAAPPISTLGFIPQTMRPPQAATVSSVIPPPAAVPAFAAPPVAPALAPAANPFAPAAGAPAPSTPPPPVAPVVPNPFAPGSAASAPNPFAPVAAAPAPFPAAALTAHTGASVAPPAAFPPSASSAPFGAPAPTAGAPAAVSSVPVPVPAFAPVEVAPATAVPSRAPGPTPSKSPGRIHGEDLIADLFESMHDLHFSRDAVEGGDFCLTLAMEKIPSLAGIIQLYDIDRREFLVTSARGAGTAKLLLRRFPESDELLATAMRRRRAVVIGDATQNEAAQGERYAALGGAWSLIVAPVMQAGRFLGAIELLNPIDGEPFTESDGNAVTYIAEQLAEFVAARGIVTDPERISMRPVQ